MYNHREEGLTRGDVLRWIEAGQLPAEEGLRLLKQLEENADLAPAAAPLSYHRRAWAAAPPGGGRGLTGRSVLVLDDGEEVWRRLRARAGAEEARISLARPGERYRDAGGGAYEIDPGRHGDYERLLDSLHNQGAGPDAIVHLWSRVPRALDAQLDRSALALFLLSKALLARRGGPRVDHLLYLHPTGEGAPRPEHAGVAGFARSLRREDPRLRCVAVSVDGATDAAYVAAVLRELEAADGAAEVRYVGDVRLTARFEPFEPGGGGPAPLPVGPEGAYLITGGAGALGARFAELLAAQGATRLVLAGRSAPDAAKEALTRRLSTLGANTIYVQADVARRSEVERLVSEARQRHGAIRGVLHGAGVLRDALVANKTLDDVRAVLDPKVRGCVWLDELTAGEPLDFFVLFSSIAGVLGSIGQCDYSYANGFLDGFARSREALRARGERAGATLSIGWPLFADGGMLAEPHTRVWLREAGLEPLQAARAVQALGAALGSGEPHVIVLQGNPEATQRLFTAAAPAPDARAAAQGLASTGGQGAPGDAGHEDGAALRARAEVYLRELLSQHIKLPASAIRPRDPFERFGIDSLMIVTLIRELERHFGELPKTLFFEHQTLEELAGYFAEHHAGAVRRQAGAPPPPRRAVPPPTGPATPAPRAAAGPERRAIAPTAPAGAEEIAIIGLAGRYPMADDVAEFWDNLRQGRDAISEIPRERWDLHGFYDPERGKPGRSYSKWGGFLRDVESFDPLFFNIAPREAELLDPQERLFLETTWHAVEDAGYTRKRLARSKVGVFVGAMYGHYQLFGAEAEAARSGLLYSSSFASIANRVSYFFNFSGPSLALDTMCSSSLTAIHLAWRSIQLGECDIAIAGGVNVTVHPYKYWLLSQGRFAASDGRCRSFGEGGDGYVPGEGVGAVLLKQLGRALRDRDQIYGVIKGSAINHGGKTNGYTVPNPKAQAELIGEALRRARVDPTDISYIEAHGTGTALGDPIEIAALTKAFQGAGSGEAERDGQRCPIGSVKSSIGHLESAAGIAAVTKVLLQLRHGELAPSLHAERLNPNISFERTPFHVQRALAPWPRPAPGEAGDDPPRPRQAGVSSFGAGGANAHLILAEHVDPPVRPGSTPEGQHLIVLSAKTEDRLHAYAERLLRFLRSSDGRPAGVVGTGAREDVQRDLLRLAADALGVDPGAIAPDEDLSDCCDDWVALAELTARIGQRYGLEPGLSLFQEHRSLAAAAAFLCERGGARVSTRSGAAVSGAPIDLSDLAYTLQVGREAMRERLAIIATDAEALAATLHQYTQGRRDLLGLYRGSARPGEAVPDRLMDGPAGKEFLRGLVRDRELDKLAQLWAWGADIDWEEIYEGAQGAAPRLISAPTYPFARERCWVRDARLPRLDDGAPPPFDERSAQAPEAAAPNGAPPAGVPELPLPRRIEREVQRMAAELIQLGPERLEIDAGLGDYGFESTTFVQLAERLSGLYGVEVLPTVFFERGSVRGLSEHLLDNFGDAIRAHYAPRRAAAAAPASPSPSASAAASASAATPAPAAPDHVEPAPEPIAIIGMSGVLPGSRDLDAFWQNLRDERDLISEVPPDRWTWARYEAIAPEKIKPRARWGGFIDDVDKFDARFFNISPLEAEMMDPQQRVFLETVWKTIEDAGYRASALSGRRVGVFAGVQLSDYQQLLAAQGEINAQMALGNEHSILVNRISYLLNLRGPSEPCNTACSSALVALHRAVRSLRSGESELAIAGGVSLMLSPYTTMSGETLGILSPDGRCKTLDASANGYVRGEGVAAVLLKPLRRALEDGDHIHAVIRGTAVNHGGKASSLTAPNSEAQAALLVDAYQEAGISPETVSYLELHGTGTKLGDPVEVEGIKTAFRQLASTRPRPIERAGYCGIGSVKTNIGHLEPAAGIAGLIKVILSMRHRTLPGLLHLEQLNPYVKLDGTPFYVVDHTRPWEPLRGEAGRPIPRRAGVSSFGFGGVNAHVILEEYAPTPAAEAAPEAPELLVLSAKTPERLRAYTAALAGYLDRALRGSEAPALADLAYTLQVGREEMPERLALVAHSFEEARDALARYAEGGGASPQLHTGSVRARKAGEEASGEEASARPHDATDLAGLAQRWVAGGDVRWADLRRDRAHRRVPAPTYPFERKRYWAIKDAAAPPAALAAPAAPPAARPAPAVAAPLAALHAPPAAPLVEGDPVLAELKDIFAQELRTDLDGLELDTSFEDYGVDSILASVIIQRLQQRFGQLIPMTAITDSPTLRELTAFIKQEVGYEEPAPARPAAAAPTQPRRLVAPARVKLPPEIVPLNTRGSRRPSFWVHGGPGYAAIYNNLARELGPDYPFYAFQARGVDNRLIPHDFNEMVDHYIQCIRLVQPDGPYSIGGYSYGGLVAYEIAQRLHRDGHGMAHLVIFDTIPCTDQALDIFFSTFGGDDNFLTIMMANEFAGSKKERKALVTLKDLEDAPVKLQAAHVAKLAKQRGKNAMSADDIYNYIRGCIKLGDYTEVAYRSYRQQPYSGSDVLYVKAREFLAEASWTGVGEYDLYGDYDYVGAWRQLIQTQCRVAEIPSDHFNLLEEPALPITVESIRSFLNS